jgi:hypothetical protein
VGIIFGVVRKQTLELLLTPELQHVQGWGPRIYILNNCSGDAQEKVMGRGWAQGVVRGDGRELAGGHRLSPEPSSSLQALCVFFPCPVLSLLSPFSPSCSTIKKYFREGHNHWRKA